MKKIVLTAALTVAAATPALAQGRVQDRGFVNVNALLQTATRDAQVSGAFPLYDEEVTFEGRREIGSGPVLDLSAGVRVWGDFGVGVGFSRFKDSSNVEITARVPDPLIFDNPHEQVVNAGELKHAEAAVHVSAIWFVPVTTKFDVAVSVGPSHITVQQDTITISEANVAPGTATLNDVSRAEVSESTIGFHAGVDLNYLVTPRIGAGLLVRYLTGSTDIAGANVDVGGLQVGGGIRVRF